MRLLDDLFTRRRRLPRVTDLGEGVCRRLAGACVELTEAEDHMAALLGLSSPPRLLLVDEETGVIIPADDRRRIASGSAAARERP